MTEQDIVQQLHRMVLKHKSQRTVAEKLGIKLAYFNDVLHGRRKPGPTILKALGLRKGYERI